MSSTARIRRIDTYADLLETGGDDRYLITQDAGPDFFRAAWAAPGAVAFSTPEPDVSGCWLNAAGTDDEAVAAVVTAALAECGDTIAGITAPRSVPLERWQAGPGTGWDIMVCEAEPAPQRAEGSVLDLAGPDAVDEVQRFLDRVNAHHSVRGDDPGVELWAGVRDEASGVLLAVGALTRRPSGVGYLASIATDRLARGRGLGSAVTARLTRRAFADGDAVCTLAHYHPNEAARSVYLGVGYRTTHRLHSGGIRR